MTIMLNGDHDGMMMNGGDGWMMIWMVIWLLIVLAVLAVAVFAIVRFTRPGGGSRDEALDVLRRRFAAGEIDEDEYSARRSNLGQSP